MYVLDLSSITDCLSVSSPHMNWIDSASSRTIYGCKWIFVYGIDMLGCLEFLDNSSIAISIRHWIFFFSFLFRFGCNIWLRLSFSEVPLCHWGFYLRQWIPFHHIINLHIEWAICIIEILIYLRITAYGTYLIGTGIDHHAVTCYCVFTLLGWRWSGKSVGKWNFPSPA